MPSINTRRLLSWRLRSWPLTALVALVAGGLAAGAVSRAQQTTDALGPKRMVAIAVDRLDPGHEVGEGDVSREEQPAGLLASPVVDDPVGRVVTSPILAGEPMVAARLAPEGARGPMALAPPGSRAVAVPLGKARPPVRPGDEVDLLSPGPGGEARLPYGRWVAREATVLEVTNEMALVAVGPTEAAPTAAAALDGAVALVLVSSR